MNEPHVRVVPVPFAFDTAIGYWTGDPDWDSLARALRAAAPDSPDFCCLDAWLARARAGDAPALRFAGVRLTLRDATLFLEGEAELVERVAGALEEALGRG